MRFLQALIAASLLITSNWVLAGYEEGKIAFDSGDYQSAAEEWRDAAEKGDARTQSSLH